MADILQVFGFICISATILFISILMYTWRPTPNMQTLQEKHVLVTGGSSGIGLEIAKEAVAQGSYVTLIARNECKLQKAAEEILNEVQCDKNKINIKVADVRDYEAISAAIRESFQWRPIDVLVCNAGVGIPSYVDQIPIECIDTIVGTNLIGTLYTLRMALPLMKQTSYKKPSAIILMGSLASLYPVYGGGVYTSTKYALRGLADNLRLELFPYNIGVTLVCPGFVETPMLTQMEDDFADPTLAEVARKVTFYDRSKAANPKDVARNSLKAAKHGYSLVLTEWKGSLLATLSAGILPADSFAKAVLHMISYIPMKLVGYGLIGYVYAIIWLNRRTRTIIVETAINKNNCNGDNKDQSY